MASRNRLGIMRSRSGNVANRLDQRANLRFVHPGAGSIKEPALKMAAGHATTRMDGLHTRPNEVGHLIGLDPGPGDHLQPRLNRVLDGSKALHGPWCSTTGQHRLDTGRLQLTARLVVMDRFVKGTVKDHLIEANSLVQLGEQNFVYGPIGEQSAAHRLVSAERQDRLGLRHDGLPFDGRVDKIPFSGTNEDPEAKAILLGYCHGLLD